MASKSYGINQFWTETIGAPALTLDPAWYWADLTDYQGYRQRADGRVRVAIELHDAADGPAVLAQMDKLSGGAAVNPPGIQVAPHYRDQLTVGRARFFTARVMPQLLVPLSMAKLRRIKLGLIGHHPGEPRDEADPLGRRMHLAELDSPVMRDQALRRLARSRRDAAASIDGLGFFSRLTRPPQPPVPRGRPRDAARAPMVAVIDFGCAFAHPAFRAAGAQPATRVRHFWDQGRSDRIQPAPELKALWPWSRPADFAYGLEATGAQLDALMQGVHAGAPKQHAPDRFEQACYVAAGLPELLQPWSHGTAVLGLAAGWPHAYHQSSLSRDAAAAADIAFVQLPAQAVDDLSGGWVTPYVLDALNYVMARREGRPLVINLCIGSHAGPHDGDSLLEAALDACAATLGVTVVLAAGNAAGKMGHAMANIPPGESAVLQWVLPAGDPTQSFLELWYDRPADDHAPQARVEHAATRSVSCGAAQALPITRTADAALPVGALVSLPKTSAGRDAGVLLLALGPTAAAGTSGVQLPLAPAGTWTVTVSNPSKQALQVHAWIERDEPGASNWPEQPSSVLVAPPGSSFVVNDENTLTAQATGVGPIAVGGYLRGWPGPQPLPFPEPTAESSRGPARRGGRRDVDVVAPSDRWVDGYARGIPALANLSPRAGQPAPGLSSDGSAGLAGTSLAAPWIARQVLNAVAGNRSLDTRAAVLGALRGQNAAGPLPALHWVPLLKPPPQTAAPAAPPSQSPATPWAAAPRSP